MVDLDLRRKLAELAGWTEIVELTASYDPVADREIRVSGLGGKAPVGVDGVGIGVGLVIPPYDESLDAQARDLWPLLRERGLRVELISTESMAAALIGEITADSPSAYIDRTDSEHPEAEAMARAIVEALTE